MAAIQHPSWCDPQHCTASADQPTGNPANYRAGTDGEHLAAPEVLDWTSTTGTAVAGLARSRLTAWLSKAVVPWSGGSTFLQIGSGGVAAVSVPVVAGTRTVVEQLLDLVAKGRGR